MTDESRTTRLRGRVVEGVRLIFMALLGAVGYQLGAARIDANDRNTVLYVFLGAACGYVLGGVFGRLTLEAVSGLERELHRRPAAQIAGGVVGLMVGLVIATLLSVPLFFLPTFYGWPAGPERRSRRHERTNCEPTPNPRGLLDGSAPEFRRLGSHRLR